MAFQEPLFESVHQRSPSDVYPFRDILIDANSFKSDGRMTTTILSHMLTTDETHKVKIVKQNLLGDLNLILCPDLEYRDITTLNIKGSENWEVHLLETDDTWVPLSKMGSGIKTILLVLLQLHCYPVFALDNALSTFYLYEELENNLHPALQRRLFEYLRSWQKKHPDSRFFITSHSHVLIDMFRSDKDVQFLHVTHADRCAAVHVVDSFSHKSEALSDLGVRSSDLLQSNCVVWVEGPSDRIYFTKWLSLVNEELEEHVDYIVAFTGGSVIDHLDFGVPNATTDDEKEIELNAKIQTIKINKNVIVLMDRDRPAGSPPKPWVTRIERQVSDLGGFAWITRGNDVENYIPDSIPLSDILLMEGLPKNSEMVDVFDSVKKYWSDSGKGDFKKVDKVRIATKVCARWTISALRDDKNLHNKLKHVANLIRGWNGRPQVHEVDTKQVFF